MSPNISED
jgi:hypothetical protein